MIYGVYNNFYKADSKLHYFQPSKKRCIESVEFVWTFKNLDLKNQQFWNSAKIFLAKRDQVYMLMRTFFTLRTLGFLLLTRLWKYLLLHRWAQGTTLAAPSVFIGFQ